MSELIHDLEEEHRVLARLFGRVWTAGVTTHEVRHKLMGLRTALYAHCKREEDALYPVLRRAAVRDENLRRLLADFAVEMTAVSDLAHSFFDRYAAFDRFNAAEDELDFARDFGRVIAQFNYRIWSEEHVLFHEYAKLAASTADPAHEFRLSVAASPAR